MGDAGGSDESAEVKLSGLEPPRDSTGLSATVLLLLAAAAV